MLSAIQILNIMQETHKSLNELTNGLEIWPDKLLNLKVKDKNIAKDQRIVNKVQEYKEKYPNIQLVIRASGTENLLRINCCAQDKEFVDETVNYFANLIKTLEQE